MEIKCLYSIAKTHVIVAILFSNNENRKINFSCIINFRNLDEEKDPNLKIKLLWNQDKFQNILSLDGFVISHKNITCLSYPLSEGTQIVCNFKFVQSKAKCQF